MEQSQHPLTDIKKFLALLPDTVLIVGKDGIVEDLLNYQPEISLRRTPDEQKGTSIYDLFQDKMLKNGSGKKLLEAFLNTMETRKSNIITYEVINETYVGYAEGYIIPFGDDYTFGIFRNITERMQAQLDAIEQKNKLSMALKAGQLSVWSYLPKTDSFDLADEETVPQPGMKLWDVTKQLVPEDRERHVRLVTDIANDIQDHSIESFRLVTPDGNIRWYEIYALGVRGDDGKVDRIIGTQKDITDQKNKIQEMIENRQQRDLLLQITNMITWEYDHRTGTTYSVGESLFFDQNIKLTDSFKIIADEFQDMYVQAFDDILNKRIEFLNIKFRVKTTDDSFRWVRLTATISKYDEQGNVLKLIGTREDITEEVEREQRLRNYIRRTDLAIQSGNIIQWDFDPKTRKYTRLYPDPSDPGNFIRKPFRFITHPDDRIILRQEQDKRMAKNPSFSNLHIRIMLEEETTYRWVNTYAVPLEYNADGTIKNITGLIIDITHVEKVEEANRMKSTFLANMSHEIRTPLNAIVGFSQLLCQQEVQTEKEEIIRIIEENNDLLLQIINDILDISKIDAGKMDFTYSDFDISEVMADLRQVYAQRLDGGVQLLCDLPYPKYIIHSEKNRLTQVIANLLSNAAKFTSSGSITMGYEPTADGLAFYVTDTGKGIDPENMKRIFERFAKFDSFVPGTGLGLSICRMIVSKLGGDITAESEPGKGTTFRFNIVCNKSSATD